MIMYVYGRSSRSANTASTRSPCGTTHRRRWSTIRSSKTWRRAAAMSFRLPLRGLSSASTSLL
ncbi:uncharacterized protein TRAVEDRAFT_31683, partial [Trametes versicolor FP-101664 SS1]|uniref:uncharacterized protein n=1 Tax=Trametes versicolor (strain FP-101664) TaxID=717944 RepID=UPI00046243B5